MFKRPFVLCIACLAPLAAAQAPEEDAPPEAAPGGAGTSPSVAPAPSPAPATPAAPSAPAPPIESTPSPAVEVPSPPVVPPPPAAATPPQPEPQRDAEVRRRENLSDFERKVEVEEAGKRAERAVEAGRAEQEAEDIERMVAQSAAEARRRAAAERRAELRRQTIARERSCVIKPVMTDVEIAHCKWVWSFPPPR